MYAGFIRFIGPEIAYTTITFDLLTYMIVGGIGTFAGPIVGTFLIVIISQNLQFLQDYRMLIFGPLLTLLIIFSPRGIVGFIQMQLYQRKRKKQESLAYKNREEETNAGG